MARFLNITFLKLEGKRMKRISICRNDGCNDIQTTEGYCRLHYMKNWKKIKAEESKNLGISFADYLVEISKRSIESRVENRIIAESDEAWVEKRYAFSDDKLSLLSEDNELDSILKGLQLAAQ